MSAFKFEGPEWFLQSMARLQRNFADRGVVHEKVQDFWECCQELPEDAIRRAFSRVLDDGEQKKFPTWAEFKRHIPAHLFPKSEPRTVATNIVTYDAFTGSLTGDIDSLSQADRDVIAFRVCAEYRLGGRYCVAQMELVEALNPAVADSLKEALNKREEDAK